MPIIVAISGSLRRKSFNTMLLRAVAGAASAGTTIDILSIRDVPVYDGDLDPASDVLNPGGTFLAKVFQSGADAELVAQLKRDFSSVRHVKPASSRQDSSERYVLAMGFRGQPNRG